MLRSARLLRKITPGSGARKGLLSKEQSEVRKLGYRKADSISSREKWLEQKNHEASPTFFQSQTAYTLDKVSKSKFKLPNSDTLKKAALVLAGGLGLAQWSLGTADDFFDYRFTIQADPCDLADFFGTEAAMEAFSIFPFVCNFLMRRGAWDDEGTYRVPILLGDYLSARIDFDERDQDLEEKPIEDQWDGFMHKAIKPGEDDDDDDEDDDDDDEDDEEGDEEGDEEEEGTEAGESEEEEGAEAGESEEEEGAEAGESEEEGAEAGESEEEGAEAGESEEGAEAGESEEGAEAGESEGEGAEAGESEGEGTEAVELEEGAEAVESEGVEAGEGAEAGESEEGVEAGESEGVEAGEADDGEKETTEEEKSEEKNTEETLASVVKKKKTVRRKNTVSGKRTSKGGLWVWISSRFRKKKKPTVLNVALDVSEVKPDQDEKTTLASEEQTTPASEEQTTLASEEQTTPASEEQTTPASEEQTTPASEEQTTPASEEQTTLATEELESAPALVPAASSDEEGDDDEEEGDEEGDDDDDEEEEDDGPKMEYFVKKETLRFIESHIKKSLFHYELEMGFNLLPNGQCEVFYRGTNFRGFFPFRIIFECHALYFMWAMERYFNSTPFGIGDLAEEAEHYRLNIPIGSVKEYLYDLIKDVEEARQVAKSKNLTTKEHEKNIAEITALLSKAGYMGAEAVLINAEDGKQQIMLNVSDKKAKAIIQRALTFNLKARQEAEAAENAGTSLARKITMPRAGNSLARKMTMRIDEKKDSYAV